MKLCAIVVTYFPGEECWNNIELYLPWVDHLIIWENTPSDEIGNGKVQVPAEYQNKVSYLSTGNNEGIAKALNEGAAWAVNNGYTHLLTMDQDSKWKNFEYYVEEIKRNSDADIAAFAPTVLDSVRNISNFNTPFQVITSGAVYVLDKYLKVGPFCEEFKIDGVDTEYSFRIRLFGYKIEVIKNAILVQEFGNLKWVPILKCYHANYSPFRIFHIVRNNIWLWIMYRYSSVISPNFLERNIIYWYFLREPILILLKGKKKFRTLYNLIKGSVAGFFKYPKSLNNYIRR